MEVRSVYKYARISPKKARDVAREIQGLPVSDAIDTLNFTPKKAAFLIGKTLKSAVANAENNHDLAADSLHVKEANISDGPSFRRYKPRARGSASAIRKRTSHIYIILTDDAGAEEKPARDRKPKREKAPVKKVEEPSEVEEESTEAAVEESPGAEEASAEAVVEESPEVEEASADAVVEESPEAEEASVVEDDADKESSGGQDVPAEEKKQD